MRWFQRKHVRSIVRRFWGTVILLVLVTAVCVQLVREAFPMLDDYREALASHLSQRLGMEVEIGAIDASWKGLHPRIELHRLSMRTNTGAEIMRVGQLEGELSLVSSLREWHLVWRELESNQLQVQFEQADTGRWAAGGRLLARMNGDNNILLEDPLDIFLLARQLTLRDSTFVFSFRTGQSAELTVPQLELENEADFHRLVANFTVDSDREAFSVVIEGRGNPRREDSFDVEGYVALENFPMEKAFAVLDLPGWNAAASGEWSEGHRLDSRLWFRGNPYREMSLEGQLRADGLPLKAPGGVQLPAGLRAEVTGQWQAGQAWWLALQQAELSWEQIEPPPLNLIISRATDQPLQMAVDRVDVQVWLALIEQIGLVRGTTAEAVERLAPRGTLSELHLALPNLSGEKSDFHLRARIDNASVAPYRGAPAVSSLDGYVEAGANRGRLVIDSRQGFSMAFPRIYDEPLSYTSAHGEVRWTIQPALRQVDVHSGLLSLSGEEGQGRGYFHLALPYPGAERVPSMTLLVGLRDSRAPFHRRYLPRTLPEKLYTWLQDSVSSGQITRAGFLWHGPLVGKKDQRTVQLFGYAEDAAVKFAPDWPSLKEAKGQLLLDNRYFDVKVQRATLAGNRITNARVQALPVESETVRLRVAGQSQGGVDQLIRLLRESPLRMHLGRNAAAWKVGGTYRADLDMRVPLSGDLSSGSQNLRLVLNEAALRVPALPFELEQINGDIHYSSDGGLTSDDLQLNLWGQPATLDLASVQAQGKPSEVTVKAQTALDAERLADWAEAPTLGQFAQGRAKVEATAKIAFGDSAVSGSTHLQLESDLVGLQIDLPQPFGKAAAVARPMTLEGTLAPAHRHYRLAYGNSVRLQYRHSDKAEALSLAFDPYFAPLHPGHADITGRLNRLDVGEWQAVLERANVGTLGGEALFGERGSLQPRVDLHLETLQVEDFALNQLYLTGLQEQGHWKVDVNSPSVVGRVTVFDDDRPVRLALQSLKLPKANESNGSQDMLAQVDLSRLPPVDFSTASLATANREWGTWSFQLRPTDGGVVLRNLRGALLGLEIGAGANSRSELLWRQSSGGNSTYLTTNVEAGDLGLLLRELDQTQLLENESASFDLELLWPGAPDELELDTLEGTVGLQIRDGRFIRGAEAGNNPLLRLFGLLNFDTLARRLQLDFSDLYKEGMVFDSVAGQMRFKNGRLLVEQPLRVESPSSTLQFAGVLDGNTEEIDASLVATLPVSGNLTIAAAFVGGLPAALGVFAVSKLFKEQVDQVSSLRYRISGAWDDPQVRVDRIFESSTDQPNTHMLPALPNKSDRAARPEPPATPLGHRSGLTVRKPPHL